MDNYTATMIAEGVQEAADEDEMIEAWQHLIDTGLAWQLQGFFGRNAQNLIEQGICHARQEDDVDWDEESENNADASYGDF